MRHVVPIFVIVLAALTVASILLPSEAWTQYYALRALAILAVGVACYRAGVIIGHESAATTVPPRRGLQFSLRTLLLIITLFSIWLGAHCNYARLQKEAVESLLSLECAEIIYDSIDPRRLRHGVPASGVFGWQEDFFGVDFVHHATSVIVDAPDVNKALPHLRHLPYLQIVYVCARVEAVPAPRIITEATTRKFPIEIKKARLAARKEALQTTRKEKLFDEHLESMNSAAEKSQVEGIQTLRRELPHIKVKNGYPSIVYGTPWSVG